MGYFVQELRFALHSLLRSGSFIIVSISTLAITIALMLTAFSVVNHYFLQPSPYPDSERLWIVEQELLIQDKTSQGFQSFPVQLEWYRKQNEFEAMTLVHHTNDLLFNLPGNPKEFSTYTTPEYFELFDVPLLLGSTFNRNGNVNTPEKEVLISEALWEKYFQRSDEVLTKFIRTESGMFSIIGVVSNDFIEPWTLSKGKNSKLWFPIRTGPFGRPVEQQNWDFTYASLRSVGKLKEESNIEAAREELKRISDALRPVWKAKWPTLNDIKPEFEHFDTVEFKDSRKLAVFLLFAALGLIFIAVLNNGCLFTTRAIKRHQELALKAVVGAKKKHLFYSVFAESLLAIMGSTLIALILTWFSLEWFKRITDGYLPMTSTLSMDYRVLIVAVLIMALLAWIFAQVVTKLVDYDSLIDSIKSSGKGNAKQVSSKVLRVLLVGQVSIATVVILSLSLFFAKAADTLFRPLGVNIENMHTVFAFSTNSDLTVPEKIALEKKMVERFEQLDYVDSVSLGTPVLQSNITRNGLRQVDGKLINLFSSKYIGSGYLEQADIALREGRFFSSSALRGEAKEMLVSRSLADHLEPDGQVIGKTYIGLNDEEYQVVGITEDVFNPLFPEEQGKQMWWPNIPNAFQLNFKLNHRQNLNREQIVETLEAVNPSLNIWDQTSLENVYSKAVYYQKLAAIVCIAVSLFTLFLAVIGIYGTMSYATAIRRYELGVRIALGSKPKHVYRLMLNQFLKPMLITVFTLAILGWFGSGVFGEWFDDWLKVDLFTFGLFTLVIVLGTSFSNFLPIYRILKQNPVAAIKSL